MHIENFLTEVYKNIPKYDDVQINFENTGITIMIGEKCILMIEKSGRIIFEPNVDANDRVELLKEDVINAMSLVKEYLNLMANSMFLQASEVNTPYKKLSEHNGVVLLGIFNEADSEYEFSIWDYKDFCIRNADRSSNYNNAKERFLQRSGLIKGKILFEEEDLIEIYKCVNTIQPCVENEKKVMN